MVQVPVTPGRSVQVQEFSGERFRYAEARDYVSGSLEQAGRQMGRAAEEWNAIEAVYDEAAAKKLDVEVANSVREALWTGDDAYFLKEGFAAAEAKVGIEERFKALRENAISQTKNQRQRDMLAPVLDKRLGDGLVEVIKYAEGQTAIELQKQSEARIAGFQEDAVRGFADPERYADNIAGGLLELEKFATDKGWSEERLDDAEEKFVSSVHTAVINGRLAADDLDGAMELLGKYRDDLSFNDAQAIESKLQPVIQFRQAEDDALVALGTVPLLGPDDASTPGTPASLATQLSAIESNESGGKQFNDGGGVLTSSAGAIGVMQVMPGTGPEAARLAGLAWDPKRFRDDINYNRALGQAYYKEQLRKFGGDPIKAAAAYNAGPGSARKGTGVMGAMARARKAGEPENWVKYLPPETQDYVAKFKRKTGAAASDGGSEPRKWDLSAAYTALEDRAKKEKWTPERLERARQRVDERVKRDEMLESRQAADEYETAVDTMDRLGKNFTDVSQIPNFDKLEPEQRIQLRGIAERNAAPEPVAANGDIALKLEILAIENPEQFLEEDLRLYRSQMTAAEFASLQTKAATIRAKPQEEIAFRGAINGTINSFATKDMALEGKPNAERKVRVVGIMENWLRGHVKPGVQPTQDQLLEALRFATGSVSRPAGGLKGALGFGDTEVRRTDLPVYQIPSDVRRAIMRAWTAEKGRPPTDQQIVDFYNSNKARFQ